MDRLLNKKTFKAIDENLGRNELKKLKILSVSMTKCTLYVTDEDDVYCFGSNRFGSLGLSMSSEFITRPELNPTLSGQELIDVSFGYFYGIGLTRSGQCWSWGHNEFGQLGTGSLDKYCRTPHRIHSLDGKGVMNIVCGFAHTLALTHSGQVYAWGRCGFGQIGNDSLADTFRPKRIRIDENVVSISCGKCHSLALTDSGIVYVWGGNTFGQLGQTAQIDPKTENPVVYCRPIVLKSLAIVQIGKAVCGAEHTVLLTTDGDVYAFGRNNCGQVGNGSQTDEYSAVKVNEEIQFKDIVISSVCDTTIGQSIDNEYYIWGLCGNRSVTRPQAVVDRSNEFKSVFDIYAKFANFNITYKAILVKNVVNDSLDQIKRQLVEKSSNRLTVKDILSDQSEACCSLKTSITSNINANYCEVSELSPKASNVSSNPLLKYFLESFNNPSNYEIRFRIDDQYIYGHKTLLSIRNNKFWQQFEHKLDNELNEIRVEDYSYKCFYAFIQYLYTNSMNVETESAADLLSLADAYDEEELKQSCCELLAKTIDSTNVCKRYSEAIERNLKAIENLCFKYVSKNYLKICLTQDFEDMNHSFAKQLIVSAMKTEATTGTAECDLRNVMKGSTEEQTVKHKRIKYY